MQYLFLQPKIIPWKYICLSVIICRTNPSKIYFKISTTFLSLPSAEHASPHSLEDRQKPEVSWHPKPVPSWDPFGLGKSFHLPCHSPGQGFTILGITFPEHLQGSADMVNMSHRISLCGLQPWNAFVLIVLAPDGSIHSHFPIINIPWPAPA